MPFLFSPLRFENERECISCDAMKTLVTKNELKYKELRSLFASVLKQLNSQSQTVYLKELKRMEEEIDRKFPCNAARSDGEVPNYRKMITLTKQVTPKKQKVRPTHESPQDFNDEDIFCPASDNEENENLDPDNDDASKSPLVFMKPTISERALPQTPQKRISKRLFDPDEKKRIPLSPIANNASPGRGRPMQNNFIPSQPEAEIGNTITNQDKENASTPTKFSTQLLYSPGKTSEPNDEPVLNTQLVTLTPVQSRDCSLNESFTVSPSIIGPGRYPGLPTLQKHQTEKSLGQQSVKTSCSKSFENSSNNTSRSVKLKKNHQKPHHSGRMRQMTITTMCQRFEEKKIPELMDVSRIETFSGGKRLSGGNTSFEESNTSVSSEGSHEHRSCVKRKSNDGFNIYAENETNVYENEPELEDAEQLIFGQGKNSWQTDRKQKSENATKFKLSKKVREEEYGKNSTIDIIQNFDK